MSGKANNEKFTEVCLGTIRSLLPYGFIVDEETNEVMFFNRGYMPISTFGTLLRRVKKEDFEKLAKKVSVSVLPNNTFTIPSGTGEASNRKLEGSQYYLYNDSTNPAKSQQLLEVYFDKLTKLIDWFM